MVVRGKTSTYIIIKVSVSLSIDKWDVWEKRNSGMEFFYDECKN